MSDAKVPSAGPTGGAPGAPANVQNKRFQQTQAQVEEVVDIMRMNVDKVLERDQKLSQLDDRADALQMGASQFEQSAGALKRKYWWKNLKMMLILGGIIAILVIVVIVWIVNSVKTDQSITYNPAPVVTPAPSVAPTSSSSK